MADWTELPLRPLAEHYTAFEPAEHGDCESPPLAAQLLIDVRHLWLEIGREQLDLWPLLSEASRLERWTFAGAAMVRGADGLYYCNLLVR